MKTTETFLVQQWKEGKSILCVNGRENVSIGWKSVRETRIPALTGENINADHNRYGENTYADHESVGETHTHRPECEGSFTGIHG